jgi:lycopene beta-cyclase
MNSPMILVGGGLQNALIALAVLEKDALAPIVLLESAGKLGGNHTWSFHQGDVPPSLRAIVDRLVVHAWPGYSVAFPGFDRTFHTTYSSIDSSSLHSVVTEAFRRAPNARLRLNTPVERVEARAVKIAGGEWIGAALVVDARGPGTGDARSGFQKFLGVEVQLSSPWSSKLPCLIDARVPQLDGFRFIYTLPLAPDRVLVEDTVYSSSPFLDDAAMRARLMDHLAARGARVERVLREERGVLPLPLDPFVPGHQRPVHGGYGGGWFHPTTGYSLPVAATLAAAVAQAWPEAPAPQRLAELALTLEKQIVFFTRLNRLLFEATRPSDRWRVLARFHRLPEKTLQRFYAMATTRGDRLRILVGLPPRGVSWSRAALAWGSA